MLQHEYRIINYIKHVSSYLKRVTYIKLRHLWSIVAYKIRVASALSCASGRRENPYKISSLRTEVDLQQSPAGRNL